MKKIVKMSQPTLFKPMCIFSEFQTSNPSPERPLVKVDLILTYIDYKFDVEYDKKKIFVF